MERAFSPCFVFDALSWSVAQAGMERTFVLCRGRIFKS